MTLGRVLITSRAGEPDFEELSRAGAQLVFAADDDSLAQRARVLELIEPCVAVVNYAELKVDRELLAAAPRLKIVANCSIGTDNLDGPLMGRAGVWGTNAPEAFTDATADLTLGLLLAVARKIGRGDRYVRTGHWPGDGFRVARWEGARLRGMTLGIVGYGKIGQAVAQRARAFGMTIVHHSRSGAGTAGWLPLDELLATADAVSLHCPLTKETQGLIDQRRLGLMKRAAILVNMSRGKVVQEQALVDALASGRLGGAGLDVFEQEPMVHPALLTMDQVVMTPHMGGATKQSRHDARKEAVRNVLSVLRGGPALTPINTIVLNDLSMER